MASKDWFPDFFLGLQALLAKEGFADFAAISKMKSTVQIDKNGVRFDRGITDAASKWRVAKAIHGFEAKIIPPPNNRLGDENISEMLSEGLCESYTAQMKISLAIFAFEAYSRCFSGSWTDHRSRVFRDPDVDLSRRVREIEKFPKVVCRIIDFLEKDNQKQRLRQFAFDAEDIFLFDFCYFIRHAYTHGALSGFEALAEVSDDLKNYILGGIRDRVNGIVQEFHRTNGGLV